MIRYVNAAFASTNIVARLLECRRFYVQPEACAICGIYRLGVLKVMYTQCNKTILNIYNGVFTVTAATLRSPPMC